MELLPPESLSLHRPHLGAPDAGSSLLSTRIEHALLSALIPGEAESPPGLAAAVRHALFPGGGRLRPKLCLSVAAACGDPDPALADAAAVAVEMMHCASLVHDDLPCFDAAETRRGLPTVHVAFGESTAVLTGDQLIVQAFEHLARVGAASPRRLPALVTLLARGSGAPFGIVAGQAWESEPRVDAQLYRRAKTGALFEAAAALGAVAAGQPPGTASMQSTRVRSLHVVRSNGGSVDRPGPAPRGWAIVGARIGEAYQVADDILDVMGDANRIGKPTGQDAALGRPNVVHDLGLAEARRLFERLVRDADAAIPPCDDPEPVRAWIREAERRARGLL